MEASFFRRRSDKSLRNGPNHCLSAIDCVLSPSRYTEPMLTTRTATSADAALITSHRRAMFLSMPNPDEAALERMSRTFEPWVKERLANGRYLGWIVEEDGHVAGSAGMLLVDWPPHPLHPDTNQRGYLLNVFVEPESRRRGLAHGLIERCLAEAERRGIRVVTLHASDAGRPVYEKFGFHSTSEMMFVEASEAVPGLDV
jgi:GNAT superfamily N-acetyltransferase